MDDLEREVQRHVLKRLPLAQAVLLLFSHMLDEQYLSELYEQYRGRCYESRLTFAKVVYLVRDALMQHGGSGHSAFTAAEEAKQLPSSTRAVYGKLERIPLKVSMALLRQPTVRLTQLLACGSGLAEATVLPASLAAFRVVAIDGKTIKHVQRRLNVLRHRRGKVTSGKGLVALDLSSGLALAMEVTEDSDANDVSLVQGLLEQLGPQTPGQSSIAARLHLADSQFCDLPRLKAFSDDGHHFLVRHNANIHFHRDRHHPVREGVDPQGRRYVQEWGYLGAANHPLRRYVRRITLYRPGEKDVSVVTDLLDEMAYPAEDLLATYLERWGIERVFQQVTEVFDLRHLIGSKPAATLFQTAFCLLLYNLVQVVRAYVARAGEKKVSEVSTEKLFDSCKKQLVAWTELGDPELAIAAFTPSPTVRQLRRRLDALLGKLWKPRWLKSPKQAIHRKTKTTVYPRTGRNNVWKILHGQQSTRKSAEGKAVAQQT